MNTKIINRSLPFFSQTTSRRRAAGAIAIPWKTLNISIFIGIILVLFSHMILVNYLNTTHFRLQKLANSETIFKNDISESKLSILETESFDAVIVRAKELGMVPNGEILYLNTYENSYVKR